jgi:hypothetical protein
LTCQKKLGLTNPVAFLDSKTSSRRIWPNDRPSAGWTFTFVPNLKSLPKPRAIDAKGLAKFTHFFFRSNANSSRRGNPRRPAICRPAASKFHRRNKHTAEFEMVTAGRVKVGAYAATNLAKLRSSSSVLAIPNANIPHRLHDGTQLRFLRV